MMKYAKDTNLKEFHHEYMANHWFDRLLDAVKSFYPTGFTQKEYEVLVWSGLQNTQAFKNSKYTLDDLVNIRNKMREKCNKSCD